jgi:hypothetical protein
MHPNNRNDRRKATNSAGLGRFDGKEVPVFLRDQSASGARLRVMGSMALPERFRLVVQLERIDRNCFVVWRRGSDCGVRFE